MLVMLVMLARRPPTTAALVFVDGGHHMEITTLSTPSSDLCFARMWLQPTREEVRLQYLSRKLSPSVSCRYF